MSDIDSRVYGYEPAQSQLNRLRAEVTRLTNVLCWVRDNMEASGEGTEEAFNMIIRGLKGGYADE